MDMNETAEKRRSLESLRKKRKEEKKRILFPSYHISYFYVLVSSV